jgi:branched-chain amino acid transport system substrate-binding protein
MPWDGIRFDATHQNTQVGGIVSQFDGEGFKLVHPGDLASAKVAWR